MLLNERYAGLLTYGSRQNVYVGGEKKQKEREDFLTLQREDLRVIDQAIWTAVQSRLVARKEEYLAAVEENPNRAISPVTSERQSSYLLSGLCECGECGNRFRNAGGNTGSGANRRPLRRYACRGATIGGDKSCSNTMYVLCETLDSAVLKSIREQILSETAVKYVVGRVEELMKQYKAEDPEREVALRNDLSDSEGEKKRLLQAIQFGRETNVAETVEALVMSLSRVEDKRKTIHAELERIRTTRDSHHVDGQAISQFLREKMSSFEQLMTGDVARARVALKHLLKSRIKLTRTRIDGRDGLSFAGETVVGALVADPEGEPANNYTGLNPCHYTQLGPEI
jgi:hypothetical protein